MVTPAVFCAQLDRLVDRQAIERVQHAMGFAGKDTMLGSAKRTLGADLIMSGLKVKKPKAKLGAGYDLEGDGTVTLKLRPKGLWYLADKGRYRSKTIRPRTKKALATPQGPRGSSTLAPSRGLGTLTAGEAQLDRAVRMAIGEQLIDNIRAAGLR